MMVSDLTRILPGAITKGPDRQWKSLKADSSRVQPGDAFIALVGSTTDGHRYIPDALRQGASLIICNSSHVIVSPDATVVGVPDTKAALRVILPMLYPKALEVRMAGITGTNGKTTTTYLIESVLNNAGISCGVMGTINTRYKGKEITSTLTTPGPVDLFEMLSLMRLAGVQACVMEVSSHALDQDRIAGLIFKYALFTNLSQDHLDYHKDMETYFLAKKRLFEIYLKGKAILNIDDPFCVRLVASLTGAITYGFNKDALIHPLSMDNSPDGLTLNITTPAGEICIRSALKGEMNAYNIMAAIGVCHAFGIPNVEITKGIEAVKGVPGRMESVENTNGLNIIVDYAHTPDALNTVLKNARQFTKGRLLTVFGCGGDRDKTKRPIMGSIAVGLADLAIITSDNPRSEEPESIIEDILKGIPNRTKIILEPDRKKAICQAIRAMAADDCLLIAGKGHEDYQIIGTTKIPFDDRECVRRCLKEGYGQ
jgi:UDP-N-acetylmuramoyl-L-alanyl-D-glutamate--2,6-diaminopimelate ligase